MTNTRLLFVILGLLACAVSSGLAQKAQSSADTGGAGEATVQGQSVVNFTMEGPAHDVLKALFDVAKVSYVIEESAHSSKQVRVGLRGVGLQDAVNLICRSAGLTSRMEDVSGNRVLIISASKDLAATNATGLNPAQIDFYKAFEPRPYFPIRPQTYPNYQPSWDNDTIYGIVRGQYSSYGIGSGGTVQFVCPYCKKSEVRQSFDPWKFCPACGKSLPRTSDKPKGKSASGDSTAGQPKK